MRIETHVCKTCGVLSGTVLWRDPDAGGSGGTVDAIALPLLEMTAEAQPEEQPLEL